MPKNGSIACSVLVHFGSNGNLFGAGKRPLLMLYRATSDPVQMLQMLQFGRCFEGFACP